LDWVRDGVDVVVICLFDGNVIFYDNFKVGITTAEYKKAGMRGRKKLNMASNYGESKLLIGSLAS